MGQSYFIWNNQDCRGMGVILRGPAAIIRPEERVQHVTIPGMAGDLTLTEGEDIFQSYIQTVSISVRGWNNVQKVQNWLKGPGDVIFSGEPDRKQKARVIGAVTLNKHSRNLDTWSGEVQFFCEPFKELLRNPDVEVLLDNGAYTNNVIRNNGDAKCYPLIHLTVDGSSTVTLTVGGKTLTMTGMGSSGARYWIDSETQQLLNNGLVSNFTYRTSGDFPAFEKGNNTITGSGWSKLVISKRERYL